MESDSPMPDMVLEEQAAFLRWQAAVQSGDASLKQDATTALVEAKRRRLLAREAVKAVSTRS